MVAPLQPPKSSEPTGHAGRGWDLLSGRVLSMIPLATPATLWLGWLACVCGGVVAQDQAQQDSSEGFAMVAAMEQTIVNAIEKAAPSVVAIARVPRDGAVNMAAEFQFNVPTLEQAAVDPTDPNYIPAHFASGVILSAEGHILTCYHALDDPQRNDYYVWWKGRSAKARVERWGAEVKAGDPWTDLAVLKIEARGLPPIPLGDASKLKRGRVVISLGNPYAIARDGQPSAAWGIISNRQRSARPREQEPTEAPQERQALAEFGTLLQTDARLNLGTSGGALIDLQGRMVGLTTSLASVAGYDQAAGYAMPIDAASKKTIESLLDGRLPAFGFLGVEPGDTPSGRGASILSVVPGLPGSRAGLDAGDVILSVQGVPTDGAQALFRELSRQPADTEVELVVARFRAGGTTPQRLQVRLGKKQLSLSKPGYSQIPEPTWRGMQVDWSTALPPQQLIFGRRAMTASVAVLRVDPDTQAWRAGLRPGQGVLSVDGQPIARPDRFYQQVESIAGDVDLEIVDNNGRRQLVTVSAVPVEN